MRVELKLKNTEQLQVVVDTKGDIILRIEAEEMPGVTEALDHVGVVLREYEVPRPVVGNIMDAMAGAMLRELAGEIIKKSIRAADE